MTLSIHQRIATSGIAVPWKIIRYENPDREAYIDRMSQVSQLIEKITVVNVNNVSDYYALHNKNEWDMGEYPCIAPPWEFCFLEWDISVDFLAHGKFIKRKPGQVGISSISIDTEKLNEVDKKNENIERLLCGFAGAHPGSFFSTMGSDRIHNLIISSRWIVQADIYVAGPLTNWRAVWAALPFFIFVDSQGCYLDMLFISHRKDGERMIEDAGEFWHVLGLTFSFASCKNVKITDDVSHHMTDKWHRRTKCPKTIRKTLQIDPMKETLRTEGNIENEGVSRALHICRGHFATYDESKPLFGRVTGTFWKPQHVRGNKKHGEIIKDYKVLPSKDNK